MHQIIFKGSGPVFSSGGVEISAGEGGGVGSGYGEDAVS